jgi:hypothetical protein
MRPCWWCLVVICAFVHLHAYTHTLDTMRKPTTGVSVPLYSAEHFYIVTKPFAPEPLSPMTPVLRDPDVYIYAREWSGGLGACICIYAYACMRMYTLLAEESPIVDR